ncbi:hypothetical protein EX30DRAFT_329181 [Ascodesmis nigricans]|uniref:Kinetochore protein SPC25 n=1 Tax=Ascodesmis nigricans TaxID=341454 RepID=A0A4S2N1X3_9PEZI|nr:hypothetical protein EX30DRAFT_329181 [Ascodesmis nigricans]
MATNTSSAHHRASSIPPPTSAPAPPPPLPSVDLGFDDLRERMTAFTTSFDEFIERGRRQLLGDRTQFQRTMTENKETQRQLTSELDAIAERELELKQQAEKDAQEALEVERVIAEMELKKKAKDEYKANLLSQIADLKEVIEKRKLALSNEQRKVASQGAKNAPEVLFWEQYLGMRFKSMGVPDKLRIIFSHVNDAKRDQECSFGLDLSAREYDVFQITPELPADAVAAVLEKLNATRNFSGFLVDMRKLFKENIA